MRYNEWRCFECGKASPVTDRTGTVLKQRFGTKLLCDECAEDYDATF